MKKKLQRKPKYPSYDQYSFCRDSWLEVTREKEVKRLEFCTMCLHFLTHYEKEVLQRLFCETGILFYLLVFEFPLFYFSKFL